MLTSSVHASSKSPFTAEQQLVLENHRNTVDSKVIDISYKLILLQKKLDSDKEIEVIEERGKKLAIDSQLALFENEIQTKNVSLTLAKENVDLNRKSVDLWLGFLSLVLAAATFFVWRMRATIQGEWDKQKEQISSEHDIAIADISASKEKLTNEVRECLIEAKDRIRELRDELHHARAIKGAIDKLHDEAAEVMQSDKSNTPEQIDEVIRKNKEKADESAQSSLVVKAMELEKEGEWELASHRWLALTDLSPDNPSYWFNYAYSLRTGFESGVDVLNKACKAYLKVINLNPNNASALSNLGNIYGELANLAKEVECESLFEKAAELYEKAINLKPSVPSYLSNYIATILDWTKKLSEEKRESKLLQAEILANKLSDLPGGVTYNLACVKSLLNKPDEARKYLVQAKDHGALPPFEHVGQDLDLSNLHSLPWFKDFLSEICEPIVID
ncbi:tetratricopeptide repeat protein [Shewanella sp. D64]|uniref:tetratricopeptide repeat protein n=1 Tax=unclassified Shewanella TaxID=196818 RepID=UPI0022BA571F|nr:MULTISPECIES: tetratricopeptide repeat protein [unclassified Shewanella]MEC4725093.1 tetratricopeptide repeat protein [Shewanella sp. D64]MEC4736994.1 tetratricopeptide repeat protein [Shewanella sp. E94]WBJ96582.1 tetratricopeptide repeat protein [Shewanella sp. MTB7]